MTSKKTFFIDVTNFIDTKLNTGIQRVLKEFLYRAIKDTKIELKLIYFSTSKDSYLLLDKNETLELLNNTSNFKLQNNQYFDIFSHTSKNKIFFEIDRVWNSFPKRDLLYKKLKESGFLVVNYIYDIIPIIYPQYFYDETKNNFPIYINSVSTYSDFIFFDSICCKNDFFSYLLSTKNKRTKINYKILHLGCDFSYNKNIIKESEKYKNILEKKYILFVGTIEPRKNHLQLLEVFEKLHLKHPELNLIFIGKFGWNIENTKEKINNHPLLNKSLFHFENIEDNELQIFYKNAFLVCYLSKYEGFGLPAVESLFHNKITLVSKNSSLLEISQNLILIDSKKELYLVIDKFLSDNSYLKEKIKIIKKYKNLQTWNNFYSELIKIFNEVCNKVIN